jgi:hypothetical protein
MLMISYLIEIHSICLVNNGPGKAESGLGCLKMSPFYPQESLKNNFL